MKDYTLHVFTPNFTPEAGSILAVFVQTCSLAAHVKVSIRQPTEKALASAWVLLALDQGPKSLATLVEAARLGTPYIYAGAANVPQDVLPLGLCVPPA